MKSIEILVEEYKKEIPGVELFSEDSFTWLGEALKMQSNGDIKESEKLLKKLILAQPDHHDGYEFLAELYEEQNNADALALITKAYEIAKGFYEEDELDEEILEEIKEKKENIVKKFGK